MIWSEDCIRGSAWCSQMPVLFIFDCDVKADHDFVAGIFNQFSEAMLWIYFSCSMILKWYWNIENRTDFMNFIFRGHFMEVRSWKSNAGWERMWCGDCCVQTGDISRFRGGDIWSLLARVYDDYTIGCYSISSSHCPSDGIKNQELMFAFTSTI